MSIHSLQDPVLKRALAGIMMDRDSVSPIFFRLSDQEQQQQLRRLLEEKPYIRVYDTIDQQLTELVKGFHPERTLSADEITQLKAEHVGNISLQAYGVWVYYPWNEKLVHLLDEEEFVRMRTNRNRYKITAEEQALLATKKIGVIGLSVGQSVSLTLSMERGYGELRIADFDELEITNLNRLRSGVHNMGLKKTVIVAREIAEIDPFLKVTCFHEGINANNLERFLLEGGKLDVLIDECDSVDIKINCRIAARRHQIPVLMEASDRGTVDVERFDLDPQRPILHGNVEHLDLSNVHLAKTMEEKLPFILPIVGVETMSTRMKASAIEIGQTISTWPQLASAVTYGGGITADVCRRILLDQYHQSGRYFIDIEELIGDPAKPEERFVYQFRSLSKDKMAELATRVPDAGGIEPIDLQTAKALIHAAALAPSPGNNQPWKWYFDGRRLHLFHDIERSESFGDFRNMTSYLTFGTAIENLRLKSQALGYAMIEQYFPTDEETLHVGVFGFKRVPPERNRLLDFIDVRVTNRHLGDGRAMEPAILSKLHQAVQDIPDIQLKFIDDRTKLQELAEIAGKAEKLRLFIPQGHYELFEKEIRWTPEDAERTKDGLDIRSLELNAKDSIGFRVSRDRAALQLLSGWGKGRAIENMTRKLVATASAVGLFTAGSINPQDCLAVGQAMQRLWLTASGQQVSIQPILAPVLHFARLHGGMGHTMPPHVEKQFRQLSVDFHSIFSIDERTEVPLFFFRMFYGEQPSVRALRLPIEDVLIY